VKENGGELVVHGLRIRIDRELCVGFGDCIEVAPEAFALDDDGVAVFLRADTVDRMLLLRACDACPVDAITVWDGQGAQVVPS
jgi:ferredoxin